MDNGKDRESGDKIIGFIKRYKILTLVIIIMIALLLFVVVGAKLVLEPEAAEHNLTLGNMEGTKDINGGTMVYSHYFEILVFFLWGLAAGSMVKEEWEDSPVSEAHG